MFGCVRRVITTFLVIQRGGKERLSRLKEKQSVLLALRTILFFLFHTFVVYVNMWKSKVNMWKSKVIALPVAIRVYQTPCGRFLNLMTKKYVSMRWKKLLKHLLLVCKNHICY